MNVTGDGSRSWGLSTNHNAVKFCLDKGSMLDFSSYVPLPAACSTVESTFRGMNAMLVKRSWDQDPPRQHAVTHLVLHHLQN